MASEKTLAMVLRVLDFSETSSIVTLFTRDFGKIGALDKGARRPKGPFESALDLLAISRIVFIAKSSDALDLLTEAKLERRFRGADRGLSCLYAGYYVAELLNELTDLGDPHPELFDAADAALADFCAGGRIGPALLHFELTALRLLGHLPSLSACSECGRRVPAEGKVSFGLLTGGVLCTACRGGRGQVVNVKASAIHTLAQLADPETDDWREVAMDRPAHMELRELMNRYISHLLGREPRLQSQIQGIWNDL